MLENENQIQLSVRPCLKLFHTNQLQYISEKVRNYHMYKTKSKHFNTKIKVGKLMAKKQPGVHKYTTTHPPSTPTPTPTLFPRLEDNVDFRLLWIDYSSVLLHIDVNVCSVPLTPPLLSPISPGIKLKRKGKERSFVYTR